MTFKLLLALAMSAIVLVGCEDSKPEVECFSLNQLCESKDATPSQVQKFLNLGADVNARAKFGKTPLMFAAGNNNSPEVISVLVKAGADVNARDDEFGWTPLMFAAWKSGNPKVMSALLKAGAVVNTRDKYGQTSLMPLRGTSLYSGSTKPVDPVDPEVLSLLLRHGADVNAKDRGSPRYRDEIHRTALIKAISSGYFVGDDTSRVIRMLIDAGADANGASGSSNIDTPGITPLMVARGPEQIAMLLQAGANVNARGPDGRTALSWAVRRGNAIDITQLIKAGANVNARGPDDRTALSWAVQHENAIDLLPLLIKAGAKVDPEAAINGDSFTPLCLALSRDCDPKVVAILLAAGADPDATSSPFSITMMLMRCSTSRTAILVLNGWTPLMFAARFHSDPSVISLLLKAGADATIMDACSQTALDYAKANKNIKDTAAYWKLNDAPFD